MIEEAKALRRELLAVRRMLRDAESKTERLIGALARVERSASGVPEGREAPVEVRGELRELAAAVIGRLNERAQRGFAPEGQNTLYLLGRLMEQGYTREQMLLVVDAMVRRWRGTEQEFYLRPTTLFGEHFESYLQFAIGERRNSFLLEDLARLATERMQG